MIMWGATGANITFPITCSERSARAQGVLQERLFTAQTPLTNRTTDLLTHPCIADVLSTPRGVLPREADLFVSDTGGGGGGGTCPSILRYVMLWLVCDPRALWCVFVCVGVVFSVCFVWRWLWFVRAFERMFVSSFVRFWVLFVYRCRPARSLCYCSRCLAILLVLFTIVMIKASV